ncbi:Hsp20/alpha crystallin family protein [Halalkalibacter urbisdiaboli]|uniref:Hsp20/alpha crystallin family protein n=1 Tax=Halalkalibacter urbisdiaboli TaxID=1960589 RepID=UPI000B43BAD0|nr:Hsp20/alpha crystallin family protein [Halalkalibacter urbisdiaboli]
MDNFSNEWSKPFRRFFDDEFWGKFDHYFNGIGNQPLVNVYESENELICNVCLPGLKKVDDIRLNVVNQNTLEISCTINLEYKGFRLIQEEINQGVINRTINLPFSVRNDKIEASYKRGLLTVHLFRLIPNNDNKSILIRDEE